MICANVLAGVNPLRRAEWEAPGSLPEDNCQQASLLGEDIGDIFPDRPRRVLPRPCVKCFRKHSSSLTRATFLIATGESISLWTRYFPVGSDPRPHSLLRHSALRQKA